MSVSRQSWVSWPRNPYSWLCRVLWRETEAQGGPATCPGSRRPSGVWTLLCPGPGACAPRLFTTPERSTWRPADAQPGPPRLPGPGDPTDVHRGAHSLPGPTGWRHLSPGAHAAVRPPPSQAAPGSLSLAAWPAEALRWQHSELLGQPCCWKAQSPCPGLGHGCAGAVQKGPTEASVPPGQRQPPAPHSGRAVAACPRGLSPHPGGQASWHPAQRASLLTGGCRGPRCAPRPGAWRAGVEGWLVKQRWLLEPKLTERVVCGSVWPWRSELRWGCWASRLHRHPVVSWGTVTRPLSQEAPGLPQRLLEGPRGQGAPPRTGSRCFAGLEPGSLRVGEELAAVGSARAACAVF